MAILPTLRNKKDFVNSTHMLRKSIITEENPTPPKKEEEVVLATVLQFSEEMMQFLIDSKETSVYKSTEKILIARYLLREQTLSQYYSTTNDLLKSTNASNNNYGTLGSDIRSHLSTISNLRGRLSSSLSESNRIFDHVKKLPTITVIEDKEDDFI